MNQLVLTSDIVEKINELTRGQQSDVMEYVSNFSNRSKNDSYRKNAIREIRRALKKSRDF